MAKRNLAAAIEEIQAEDTPPNTQPNGGNPPANEDTPPANEDTPPANEDTPPANEDTPPANEDTPPANQDTPPQPEMTPAQHAFFRQMQKQEQRHKDEIAELNRSWEAKLAELKNSLPKPPAPAQKTREEFPDDDSFIAYLVEEGVKKKLAERDADDAKKAAEQAEQAKAQQAADAELQERRTAWQNTVAETFGQDTVRRDAFMKRVSYCNERGLGKVLENSPVAANYLMGSPTGVKVFEKLLMDVNTMKRVFNDQTAADPFSMFWELKQVEQEVLSAEAQQAQTQAQQTPTQTQVPPQKPTLPHGRPGRQAAGNTPPDIWSDDKALLDFIRS